MKNIIAILFLLTSQIASADDFGKQVKFYADNSGPQFGTTFAYDSDKFWSSTFSLWGGDLSPDFTLQSLSWRLFDSNSGNYINSWTTDINGPSIMSPGTIAFSWNLSDETKSMAAVNALRSLKLVLSVNQNINAPIPTHFVDLGSYCASHPNHFMNLTKNTSGCSLN